MYKNVVKRLIDIVLSLVGIILASWLYLIIIIAIKIDDPGLVFLRRNEWEKERTHSMKFFNFGMFRRG